MKLDDSILEKIKELNAERISAHRIAKMLNLTPGVVAYNLFISSTKQKMCFD